jgi:hypothetical protein
VQARGGAANPACLGAYALSAAVDFEEDFM